MWDIERGKSDGIEPYPWQTDTCIGDWHYRRSLFEEHRYVADVAAASGQTGNVYSVATEYSSRASKLRYKITAGQPLIV